MPLEIFATTTDEMTAIGRGVKRFLQILLSPELQHQLWPLQIIFVLFALFFVWMIVYYSLRTTYWNNKFLGDLKNFLFPKIFEKKSKVRRWQKIEDGLGRHFEDQWKLCLIEAADFLNESLKEAGFGGSNLEERLQRVTVEDISNLEALNRAQKVCADIVRDHNYKLTKAVAKDVIDQIEEALKELGVL